MKTLLIVAHAPSDNTQRMVQAILRGATAHQTSALRIHHRPPLEAGPQDVLDADAVILATTENLGYMSGALKDFFDRSYYPLLDKTHGRPYALCVRAGHDGTGTCRAVQTIMTGLKWRAVAEPLVCKGPWKDRFIDDCEGLGALFAASLDAGLF